MLLYFVVIFLESNQIRIDSNFTIETHLASDLFNGKVVCRLQFCKNLLRAVPIQPALYYSVPAKIHFPKLLKPR
jgi:hypothetical protein